MADGEDLKALYERSVPPDEAIKLCGHLDRYAAIITIHDRLKSGLIRAVARHVTVEGRKVEYGEIVADTWQRVKQVLNANLWQSGDITISIPRGHAYEPIPFSFFAVRLDLAGIEEIPGVKKRTALPPSPPPIEIEISPVPESLPGKGKNLGGRPPKDWWDDLWVEICRQLFDGTLQPKRQADVEKAMQAWIEQNGFDASEQTIRPRARKLWNAIGGEGNN